jgi:hypothetical protein
MTAAATNFFINLVTFYHFAMRAAINHGDCRQATATGVSAFYYCHRPSSGCFWNRQEEGLRVPNVPKQVLPMQLPHSASGTFDHFK